MEFPRGRLRTNSFWRPFGSLLLFAIPGDSLSGIPLCFPPLGFTLIVSSLGTQFSPLWGKTEFLANKNIKVNPNGGKQGGIPEMESSGIANNKSDPNGRQKELVPRRPRRNSNKNPSGSNSAVPAKAKGNPQRESPFEFYIQVQSEWAPKGNKFLSACKNFLCTVGFLRRAKSEQKGNHSEALAREICSSGIS